MTIGEVPDVDVAAQAPLFILSFNHRDELALAAARAGWQSIAARRRDSVEYRFASSRAMIAVVDARGAFDEGLEAVAALSAAVEISAAALLVIVSRRDVVRLDAMINAGATHYLAAPFSQAEFGQSLRFAERHSARLGGGWQAVERRHSAADDEFYAWQVNLKTGQVTLSEAFCKRINAPSRDMAAFTLLRGLDGMDRKVALGAIKRILSDGRPTAFGHMLLCQDGSSIRVAEHLRYDRARGILISTIEFLNTEPKIQGQGGRDPLTGLGDLAAARRWIDACLASRDDAFHILLIVVTRFEMINSAFGREIGDGLLQNVARQIGRLVTDVGGDQALVARTAGAEFIVGLDGAHQADRVRSLAERIADQIDRPTLSGAHLVTLSSRIVIVECAEGDGDSSRLLRRAGMAVAEAKASDQGRIRFLSTADQNVVDHHQSLQSDLRNALDRDEIELLFQPQVAIPSGEITGVEALARWRHPVHGELGAVTLFAVAEQSDYLLALSAHVQKRAAEQAAAWPASLSHVRLSVNVTAADIARPGFAASFLAMIDASGFPRNRLTVELTESGLVDDLGVAAELLADLRAGGCRVAIDDFGTGYSSLAYLKALPLDYLKIDKKLAQDIAGSPRDRIVVRGVIDMARSLGLAVIAEGVETEEQLALLAREGCNYYQGFLCAEPLDVAGLERALAQG
ncbi:MAG: phosphodiesterase [Pseudomonadota bacterium]